MVLVEIYSPIMLIRTITFLNNLISDQWKWHLHQLIRYRDFKRKMRTNLGLNHRWCPQAGKNSNNTITWKLSLLRTKWVKSLTSINILGKIWQHFNRESKTWKNLKLWFDNMLNWGMNVDYWNLAKWQLKIWNHIYINSQVRLPLMSMKQSKMSIPCWVLCTRINFSANLKAKYMLIGSFISINLSRSFYGSASTVISYSWIEVILDNTSI